MDFCSWEASVPDPAHGAHQCQILQEPFPPPFPSASHQCRNPSFIRQRIYTHVHASPRSPATNTQMTIRTPMSTLVGSTLSSATGTSRGLLSGGSGRHMCGTCALMSTLVGSTVVSAGAHWEHRDEQMWAAW